MTPPVGVNLFVAIGVSNKLQDIKDKTKVTIVVDPDTHSNSHELRIKGEFGEMTCHTYNVPSPDNPRTSYLAAMSAISALKRIVRNEWIGI